MLDRDAKRTLRIRIAVSLSAQSAAISHPRGLLAVAPLSDPP
jgi:hypothetical protein